MDANGLSETKRRGKGEKKNLENMGKLDMGEAKKVQPFADNKINVSMDKKKKICGTKLQLH